MPGRLHGQFPPWDSVSYLGYTSTVRVSSQRICHERRPTEEGRRRQKSSTARPMRTRILCGWHHEPEHYWNGRMQVLPRITSLPVNLTPWAVSSAYTLIPLSFRPSRTSRCTWKTGSRNLTNFWHSPAKTPWLTPWQSLRKSRSRRHTANTTNTGNGYSTSSHPWRSTL